MYRSQTGFMYKTCVSFNEQLAAALRMLIDQGLYASESEAFRQALLKMVREEHPEIYEKAFIKKEYAEVLIKDGRRKNRRQRKKKE